MKITKKQLDVLIEQIVGDMQEDNGPFGEVFPDEEYIGLVESSKAHIDRIEANIKDMMKLSGDSPGYDHSHTLRLVERLKKAIYAM